MAKTLIIDAGHGGIHPVTGQYVTAPDKMYKFPDGTTVYEGVINRHFAFELYAEATKQGLQVIEVFSKWKDTPLLDRVTAVNKMAAFTRDAKFVCLHCNASREHDAHGSEIFTTKGQTHSDPFATAIMEEAVKQMPDLKIRADKTRDGDIDKEADFYMIKHTDKKLPAVLLEFDFFDNWTGYMKLIDKEYQKAWARAIVRATLRD